MSTMYIPLVCRNDKCKRVWWFKALRRWDDFKDNSEREKHARDSENWPYATCPALQCGGGKLALPEPPKHPYLKTPPGGQELMFRRDSSSKRKATEKTDTFAPVHLVEEFLDDLDSTSSEEVEDGLDLYSDAPHHTYKGSLGRLNDTDTYPHPITHIPDVRELTGHVYAAAIRIQDKAARKSGGGVMGNYYAKERPIKPKYASSTAPDKYDVSSSVLTATSVGETWAKLAPHDGGKRSRSNDHLTYEWCHAVADCLGGASVPTNFFAGSYDANTFMACIEERLRAFTSRTALALTVTGYYQGKGVSNRTSCRRAPKWVKYTIECRAKGSLSLTYWIDAQCVGFNRTDWKRVREILNSWLKKVENSLNK